MKLHTKKLCVAGILVALSVTLSTFSIPIGASRCFPIQHLVNVIAAVFLGPFYGCSMAFVTSLIRNLLGTGSLLAFPGSMIGALLAGMVYQKTRNQPAAYISEVFGTGILGGICAYPVAALIMGKDAGLFTFVLPFLMSTITGTIFAAIFIGVLQKAKVLDYLQSMLEA